MRKRATNRRVLQTPEQRDSRRREIPLAVHRLRLGGGGTNFFENELVAGTVQLIPDARTNRILVITRPVNFPYIKQLIGEFDEVVGSGAPLVRPLKYVSASAVLPVLADLLVGR